MRVFLSRILRRAFTWTWLKKCWLESAGWFIPVCIAARVYRVSHLFDCSFFCKHRFENGYLSQRKFRNHLLHFLKYFKIHGQISNCKFLKLYSEVSKNLRVIVVYGDTYVLMVSNGLRHSDLQTEPQKCYPQIIQYINSSFIDFHWIFCSVR